MHLKKTRLIEKLFLKQKGMILTISQRSKTEKKIKDPTTDQSLVFESLLKNSSIKNSDFLFNEVEKLNLASMEFLSVKENQRKEKSFLDRLFQSKPRTSSK